MVNARELLSRLRKLGAEIVLVDGGQHAHLRLGAIPVPEALLDELRASKDELCSALRAEQDALANARAIRERRYPIPCAPANCTFHIGAAGERCRRCGASWNEHHSIGGARS